MRRTRIGTLALLTALALAGSALAVDVQLKDGKVIHAVSYKVQGSYVLVRLENGSQVAYDLGDINLEAMKAAEKAAEPAPAPKPAPPGNAFAGAMAANRGKATLKITDQDVSHVDTGPARAVEKREKKPLADHKEGGQVVVQGVRVDPGKKPGTWLAMGQVVNRKSEPVMDVRVIVQAVDADSKAIGEAELPVASSLEPGQSGKFLHVFKASKRPLLRVRVFWMEQVRPSATPGAGAGQGGPPPGSNSNMGGQVSGSSSSPSGATTNPAKGPPSLQWGGASAYGRGEAPPPPTPRPY